MIVSNYNIGLEVEVDNWIPLVIIIEKESTLIQFISDIRKSINENENTFLISDNEKNLNLSKEAELIIDPWNVDCNSKAIKSKLFQYLGEIASEQNEEEFLQIKSSLFKYIEEIEEHIPYSLTYNLKLDPILLFKSMDVSINVIDSDLINQLVDYMKLLQSLCKTKILVLINIKLFFSNEEIELLYKEATYINMQLILVEHIDKDSLIKEKKVIVDKDNCIIIV